MDCLTGYITQANFQLQPNVFIASVHKYSFRNRSISTLTKTSIPPDVPLQLLLLHFTWIGRFQNKIKLIRV